MPVTTETASKMLLVTYMTVTQRCCRRESVRIFGIRQAEGETAEQVEQKALGVFKEAGADVKEEDIAAVHRLSLIHI